MTERPELAGLAQLGSHFDELASLLTAMRTGPPDPELVVRVAAHALPHQDLGRTPLDAATHCALTLVRGNRRPATVAATGELPRQVDVLQYDVGDGPCLEASKRSDVVQVDDLAAESRWPEFARRCVAETGVRSMLSVRLNLSDDDRGAINFYALEPKTFDDLDLSMGVIFAPFAALALQNALNSQKADELHVALRSSRQIGTAIGILMAREHVTSEQAFAELAQASQHLNRKLRDIAAEVEETGELPRVGKAR